MLKMGPADLEDAVIYFCANSFTSILLNVSSPYSSMAVGNPPVVITH